MAAPKLYDWSIFLIGTKLLHTCMWYYIAKGSSLREASSFYRCSFDPIGAFWTQLGQTNQFSDYVE